MNTPPAEKTVEIANQLHPMTVNFKLPKKTIIKLVGATSEAQRELREAGLGVSAIHQTKTRKNVPEMQAGRDNTSSAQNQTLYPPTPMESRGEPQENFPVDSTRRIRRRQIKELPKLSLKPPHTKFAVIPSRAITDPRINTRKPLLLLLGAIGIHASVHGICYPSQRRLAMLCGKSHSWACKYLHELIRIGYIRRLVPPTKRGTRQALRLQVMWSTTQPLPSKETAWEKAPWCWR
jgi:hypothetical protein